MAGEEGRLRGKGQVREVRTLGDVSRTRRQEMSVLRTRHFKGERRGVFARWRGRKKDREMTRDEPCTGNEEIGEN